ncbi:PEGA domain-containing protein [Marinobacter sp. SS21]|uniref:PEGA domain-containing protein n=1 Tax=Marinobacter sp. SS21 TaxID=2979460 RepID=UPI0023304145|nr:PEGA domain-containing protein [Marinobacter sp. SS21]MDC0664347.1 PEGA domain-containing protein [Marinobacter sp. SS21]
MVDFRPLLFINALAFMLLVTAGFASIHDSMKLGPASGATPTGSASEPTGQPVASGAEQPTSAAQSVTTSSGAKEQPPIQPPARAEVAQLTEAPGTSRLPAAAEPPSTAPVRAMATETDAETEVKTATLAEPFAIAAEAPEPPTTGQLILRSNVHGDEVTVNGKGYGPTRLNLTLEPGRYEVKISKNGFKSWTQSIVLEAGESVTLMAQLEKYTQVDHRNGTWIGGVKTGDGSYQDATGLRYQGHFIAGKFHGHGTVWYPDGARYEGDWKAGVRHGEGLYRAADNSSYTGQFADNQFNGQGTLTLPNGDILAGQWQDSALNGHGSLTTGDGMLYVGGFRNGEFHGAGTLTYPDGRHYEGEFSNGSFYGAGAEVFASGKKYQGQYLDGKFHGKGLLLNPNGSSIEATFRHGEPYGQVRLTTAAGEVFTARTSEPGVCYREKSYRATQCPVLEGW